MLRSSDATSVAGRRARLAALDSALPYPRHRAGVLVAAFLLLIAVPLVNFLGRPLAGFHLPGSATYTQQLTFYLAFLGGLVATWTGKTTDAFYCRFAPGGYCAAVRKYFSTCAAASVTAMLTYASVSVVLAERQQGDLLSFGMPTGSARV